MAHEVEFEEVLDLLGRVWTWFRSTHEVAARRGLSWSRSSTPFVRREEGRAVSHVGVLELPLVVNGRSIRAAGVHAVATDPEFRGRGLMRSLMERALAFVDDRYETAVLTAGEPDIYRKFGFEVVPEMRFVGAAPARRPGGGPAWRDLDPDEPADRKVLHRLLRDRAPASRILGVGREADVFLFDSANGKLRYAEDLDAIVWGRVKDDTLVLSDLVAESVPTLADIAARVPAGFSKVEVQFSPDRLAAALEPEPWLYDGDEFLMARGPFVEPGSQVCLPRGARC